VNAVKSSICVNLGGSYSNDSAQYYIRAFHGRYVAAHPDGLLVTDDEDTNHHDIQWIIVNREYGKVALQSVKHQTFLSAEQGGSVRCSDRTIEHDCLWEIKDLGYGKYGFQSRHHHWLIATGMTDETPPEEQPHLMAHKEHPHEHAHFEIIPVQY